MKNVILILLLVLITACNKLANEGDAQKFFSDHKIGYSADFGLFANNHELVAAVFGFGDDLKVCLKFADTMNKEDPGTFSCKPLNH